MAGYAQVTILMRLHTGIEQSYTIKNSTGRL